MYLYTEKDSPCSSLGTHETEVKENHLETVVHSTPNNETKVMDRLETLASTISSKLGQVETVMAMFKREQENVALEDQLDALVKFQIQVSKLEGRLGRVEAACVAGTSKASTPGRSGPASSASSTTSAYSLNKCQAVSALEQRVHQMEMAHMAMNTSDTNPKKAMADELQRYQMDLQTLATEVNKLKWDRNDLHQQIHRIEQEKMQEWKDQGSVASRVTATTKNSSHTHQTHHSPIVEQRIKTLEAVLERIKQSQQEIQREMVQEKRRRLVPPGVCLTLTSTCTQSTLKNDAQNQASCRPSVQSLGLDTTGWNQMILQRPSNAACGENTFVIKSTKDGTTLQCSEFGQVRFGQPNPGPWEWFTMEARGDGIIFVVSKLLHKALRAKPDGTCFCDSPARGPAEEWKILWRGDMELHSYQVLTATTNSGNNTQLPTIMTPLVIGVEVILQNSFWGKHLQNNPNDVASCSSDALAFTQNVLLERTTDGVFRIKSMVNGKYLGFNPLVDAVRFVDPSFRDLGNLSLHRRATDGKFRIVSLQAQKVVACRHDGSCFWDNGTTSINAEWCHWRIVWRSDRPFQY